MSGDVWATGIGEYETIVTPKDGFTWSDGSTDPVAVTWSIKERSYAPFLWLILVDMVLALAIMLFRMR